MQPPFVFLLVTFPWRTNWFDLCSVLESFVCRPIYNKSRTSPAFAAGKNWFRVSTRGCFSDSMVRSSDAHFFSTHIVTAKNPSKDQLRQVNFHTKAPMWPQQFQFPQLFHLTYPSTQERSQGSCVLPPLVSYISIMFGWTFLSRK